MTALIMGAPLNVTEWMKGFVGRGATDSDAGYITGVTENTPFMHEVKIHIDDIDRFVDEPTHTASMEGFIDCPLFGANKNAFRGGMFNMLVDTSNPGLKVMLYRMPFVDGQGQSHTALGNKTINDDRALDLLHDIMTLTVAVFAGDVPGPLVSTPAMGPAQVPAQAEARGVIHIQWRDGIRSGMSFESPGSSLIDKEKAIAKFGSFYMGRLWNIFAKGLSP